MTQHSERTVVCSEFQALQLRKCFATASWKGEESRMYAKRDDGRKKDYKFELKNSETAAIDHWLARNERTLYLQLGPVQIWAIKKDITIYYICLRSPQALRSSLGPLEDLMWRVQDACIDPVFIYFNRGILGGLSLIR